jgi:hypothetical protein
MKERLYERRYSVEKSEFVDYVISQDRFDKVLERLESEYFAGRMISDIGTGETITNPQGIKTYLISGGNLVRVTDAERDVIHLLSESVNGLVGMTEFLHLPFKEEDQDGSFKEQLVPKKGMRK